MGQVKKKRGAQPGNLNACKCGFYSRCLDADVRREITRATEIEGLDAEIALLRVKIKNLLKKDPDNMELFTPFRFVIRNESTSGPKPEKGLRYCRIFFSSKTKNECRKSPLRPLDIML